MWTASKSAELEASSVVARQVLTQRRREHRKRHGDTHRLCYNWEASGAGKSNLHQRSLRRALQSRENIYRV